MTLKKDDRRYKHPTLYYLSDIKIIDLLVENMFELSHLAYNLHFHPKYSQEDSIWKTTTRLMDLIHNSEKCAHSLQVRHRDGALGK